MSWALNQVLRRNLITAGGDLVESVPRLFDLWSSRLSLPFLINCTCALLISA